MNKIFFLTILFLLTFNNYSLTENNGCSEFNKFSTEYLKCKGNFIKDKTISTGKNIVEETKEYQSNEWLEEQKKIFL